GDLALLDRLPERFTVHVGVDAQQGERLVREPLHELALIGVHPATGAAPVARERQDDDLAAVVAQLEGDSIHILAIDVRRDPAQRQVAKLVEAGLRDLAKGLSASWRLEIAELRDGAFEQPIGLVVKRLGVGTMDILEETRMESGDAERIEGPLRRSI